MRTLVRTKPRIWLKQCAFMIQTTYSTYPTMHFHNSNSSSIRALSAASAPTGSSLTDQSRHGPFLSNFHILSPTTQESHRISECCTGSRRRTERWIEYTCWRVSSCLVNVLISPWAGRSGPARRLRNTRRSGCSCTSIHKLFFL